MHVRDAVEADAPALAARVDLSTDAVRQLIHDRTVCVVEDSKLDEPARDGSDPDESDRDGATSDDPCGFLAFDADEGAVHVTQVAGDRAAVSMLLDEPIRFAASEGMTVEVFVPDTQWAVVEAIEAAGFESIGEGKRFDGMPIHRYRLDAG